MARVRTFATASIALVLLTATVVPTASGATARLKDDQGDAPAAYDVTAVRYVHSASRVVAVARVPGLGDRGRAQLSVTHFTTFEAGWVGQISKRPGAAARVRLFFFDHVDLNPRPCSGLEGSWGEGRIRISIPKDCMEGDVQDANRLFSQFAAGRGNDFDLAPAVRRLREG
ncbi:hypothetical protein FE634_19920 [Nocardioides dongxiaopingii]|uniref:hypothetical protein n=1 Tax=Nocardioides sp. S-1144 TaxID=2582905 RepID=UPI00110EA0BC|nr:hypothetical protein [Nocardioides sp. S-1144]QCW52118.1 hypothetical protein FE634_19920 [Nocardioides sp. S-1144]